MALVHNINLSIINIYYIYIQIIVYMEILLKISTVFTLLVE